MSNSEAIDAKGRSGGRKRNPVYFSLTVSLSNSKLRPLQITANSVGGLTNRISFQNYMASYIQTSSYYNSK